MRLYKMGDTTKQVRVDNWGIFFLQRLQMFFSKTDYCDMTLQFEGNVQLKVHRLVMNACTEYFQFLEQTCTLEDNVIMMPSDLQADVIVPIVNFMYTGMLEFQLSIFDRLYKTAQVMNITILTKLLDAQKQPVASAVKNMKRKMMETPHVYQNLQAKKPLPKPSPLSDLPAPLPGRKLPVWKRKTPTTSQPQTHGVSPLSFPEVKWSPSSDPLSLPDNTPKPTRFEWPDEDLPPLNLSFEEISYTSKPLLTQEEENRASTSFDDLKHIPNANRTSTSSKKRSSPSLDMEEMKNYVKEQKIRSGLSHDDEGEEAEVEGGVKRKAGEVKKGTAKKVRFDEQENKTTTISIATDKSGGELNHEKIVTEILRKYPQLVKKNKNIKLKIMTKNKTQALEPTKVENIQIRAPRLKVTEVQKPSSPKPAKPDKAPWRCDRCSTEEEPVEFVLYYLYRKHMTDVHSEKLDPKLCKYCGHRCNKQSLLLYHLHTKHGVKPPPSHHFPKCDQCPFIAPSPSSLIKHKLRHDKDEMQCVECKLAFSSAATLANHMQITGHSGKAAGGSFDCQYCTKRFQSGVNLFSHVRLCHKIEALRDGIVSIDEEAEEGEEEKDEYILPEIISEPELQTKKVNILSNVKVQDRREQQQRHQQLNLEPSSEAEALNNVATGIATSLGLVDIVVLNDNQQFLLQPDHQQQHHFATQQNDQSEFILPELTGRETFTQGQNEVITTDGVITQSMLSSGDIATTDELVMVLTDHDYGDNQEEINNDNSNIVVLYSHPVDGQQDQFITSQGNIMVNSQTGLIEIRNGATITSTANQVVMNPQETHIESIEMIQREIESHGELKQETLYEEDSKPAIEIQQKETEEKEVEIVVPRSDPLIETLNQGEQIEFTSPMGSTEEAQPVVERTEEPTKTVVGRNDENDIMVEENESEAVEDPNCQSTEPVEDSTTTCQSTETTNQVEETEKESSKEPVETPIEEKGKEVAKTDDQVEEPQEDHSLSDVPPETEPNELVPIPTEEEKEESIPPPPPPPPEEGQTTTQVLEEETGKEEQMDETQAESKEDPKREAVEIEEEPPPEEDRREELSQSESSTSQFNDENSQSSQESRNKEPEEAMVTKISILDDWEDTDSQQSDKEKAKEVGETVHKLMDDWDEEEEDGKEVEG